MIDITIAIICYSDSHNNIVQHIKLDSDTDSHKLIKIVIIW